MGGNNAKRGGAWKDYTQHSDVGVNGCALVPYEVFGLGADLFGVARSQGCVIGTYVVDATL
ncbi:hypothetical protein KI387_024379, partial [Taxus chinensis]